MRVHSGTLEVWSEVLLYHGLEIELLLHRKKESTFGR